MVIEFHFLDENREEFKNAILEIKKTFNLIHLHANNYAGYCKDGLPKVLEITFTNKKHYKILSRNFLKKAKYKINVTTYF